MSVSEEKSNNQSEPEVAGQRPAPLALLVLTALGVVYGDIGTSPLYAVRQCFFSQYGLPASHLNVLGVLSLIVWSLLLVISLAPAIPPGYKVVEPLAKH